jgi:tetratricopeptide (TPR) repeat protein
MGRGTWAGVAGVAGAALGAWLGQLLGRSAETAGLGAVVGGVSCAFAPDVTNWLKGRGARRAKAARSVELSGDIYQPSRLLDPARGVVAFIGRDDNLRDLVAWCEDDTGPKLRLITGPGGVGKTRLALQLAEWLETLGWQSVRVGDGYEADIVSNIRESNTGRLLLIVDYAETRTKLADLLRAVAVDDGTLRVLLLARNAGQWWQQLGASEPAIRDLIADAGQEGYVLGEVLDAELSDEDLIRQAVPVFARELGVDPPDHIQIIARNERARVLELHAAALVAVMNLSGEPKSVVQVNLANVLKALLAHEERFWIRSARAQDLLQGPVGLTVDQLRQIIAAACFLGAKNENDVLNLLHRVPGVPSSAKLATWIRDLYPPGDLGSDWIGSIQPDRLAELHVVNELDRDSELTHRCLTGLDRRQLKRALTLLAHASVEIATAADLLRQLLVFAEKDLEEVDASRDTLTAIAIAIDVPYLSLRLARVQATIVSRIIDSLPATEPSLRGIWLHYYGVKLSQLERSLDGIGVLREAVEIYRSLAASSRDRYRPQLARVLIALSSSFARMMFNVNAFETSKEAVAIFEELAAVNPGEYLQSLAEALSTHCHSLTILNRLSDAYEAVERALTIFEEVSVTNPEGTRYGMAIAKFRLVVLLQRVGEYHAALEVAQDALPAFEELAATSLDHYRSALMIALIETAACLTALGRLEDAIRFQSDAVTISRELRAYNPEYRRRLVGQLRQLADLLSRIGNESQAAMLRAEADQETPPMGVVRLAPLVPPDDPAK